MVVISGDYFFGLEENTVPYHLTKDYISDITRDSNDVKYSEILPIIPVQYTIIIGFAGW